MTTATLPAYTLPMQRDVAAFHNAFGQPNRIATPGPLPLDRIELRLGLIREEGIVELQEAIDKHDIVEIIDALIDTVYVSLGTCVEMGLDADNSLLLPTAAFDDSLGDLVTLARNYLAANEIFVNNLEFTLLAKDAQGAASQLANIAGMALYTLRASGIDPQPFFDEVQRANMSKLGADGKPIHSRGMELDGYPEGKALKGPNYVAPDLAAVYQGLYGKPMSLVSPEFKRGARAAAEAMRYYFLDENEGAIYDVSTTDLESFEKSAIHDALGDEQERIERGRPVI